MSYTPPPIEPTTEAQLKEAVGFTFMGQGISKEGQQAIMTIAKASPEHAADLLANIKEFTRASVSSFGSPSKQAKNKVIAAFTSAAIDYSRKSQQQDEPVVEALATLAAVAGTRESKDSIRTKLHQASQDAAAVQQPATPQQTAAASPAAKPSEGKSSDGKPRDQVQVDTSGPAPAEDDKKTPAQKNADKSEKALGDAFGDGLIQVILMLVGGLFGVDLSKMFGGEKDKAAEPQTPDMNPQEATKAGKSQIESGTDAKGAKTYTTAEKVTEFLKHNGVSVAEGDDKTEAMWKTMDDLRKAGGAATGGRIFNDDDKKLLDKVHDEFVAKESKNPDNMTLVAPGSDKPMGVIGKKDMAQGLAHITGHDVKEQDVWKEMDALRKATGGDHVKDIGKQVLDLDDITMLRAANEAAKKKAPPAAEASTPAHFSHEIVAENAAKHTAGSYDIAVQGLSQEQLAQLTLLAGARKASEAVTADIVINGKTLTDLGTKVNELYAKSHGGQTAGLHQELAEANPDGSFKTGTQATAQAQANAIAFRVDAPADKTVLEGDARSPRVVSSYGIAMGLDTKELEKLAVLAGGTAAQAKPQVIINGQELGELSKKVDQLYAASHDGKHASLKEELAALAVDNAKPGTVLAASLPTPRSEPVTASGRDK